MTDRDIQRAYADLLDDADDQHLVEVVRDLTFVFPRVQPTSSLVGRIRVASTPPPARVGRWIPRRTQLTWQPAVLALAGVLAVAVAGGAGYAMHLAGGSSQVHLASSCQGTSVSIAAPAFEVPSPQQFAAQGGTLIAQGIKKAARLPHPQYWVIPAGAVIVDTCRFTSGNQIEIGTNTHNHTELQAISYVPFNQATQPWLAGPLRVPSGSDCPVRTTNPVIIAPDGRFVAQLRHVPASFARSIAVTLPPCGSKPSTRPATNVPATTDVSFRVLSQIRYSGTAGTVVLLTIQPSRIALRPGLNLGNRIGNTHNGYALFDLPCHGGCPAHDVRWLRQGIVVSLSGNLSIRQLQVLAADVVVR